MNGDTPEGEIVYPNMDKCKWYAEKINKQKDLTLLPDIGVSFGDKSVFDYRKNVFHCVF